MSKNTDVEIKRIFKNEMSGGYSAYFKYKNKYYYADISCTLDCGNECMIFSADENENVTDWTDLYCNHNVFISEDDLIKCIKEFCLILDGKEQE